MARRAKLLVLVVFAASLAPATAWSQTDGAVPVVDASLPDAEILDASLPDASVGEGGADRENQETDDSVGRTKTTCRSSADCDRGFQCEGTRCTYGGFRRADNGGCALGADAALLAFGLAAAVRRRVQGRRARPIQ